MPCARILSNETANITSGVSNFFVPEPEALRLTRTTLFGLTAALSLIGNYVVCRAVWRQPGTKPFAHFLISNLAFAELLSTVCLVFTFHAYEPPWSWKLGYFMCKTLEPLQIACLLVITTTLAIIAIYRCLLMVRPLTVRPSPAKRYAFVIFTWMGSLGMSVPASFFRVVITYENNCETNYCHEIFPEGFDNYQDAYSIVLFVVNFVVPLFVMIPSYALVSKKIKEHLIVLRRLQGARANTLSMTPSHLASIRVTKEAQRTTCENYNKVEENKINQRHGARNATYPDIMADTGQNKPADNNRDVFERENDVLKMVFTIVFIFAVCYIPYQVQFLMQEFGVKEFLKWPHRFTFARLVFSLTCLPSALHPICYGIMSTFYRKAFTRIIACRWYKRVKN